MNEFLLYWKQIVKSDYINNVEAGISVQFIVQTLVLHSRHFKQRREIKIEQIDSLRPKTIEVRGHRSVFYMRIRLLQAHETKKET